ncbi:MAG: hypothetical protein ACRCUY_08725 [Thermoguttaceae bacterium]
MYSIRHCFRFDFCRTATIFALLLFASVFVSGILSFDSIIVKAGEELTTPLRLPDGSTMSAPLVYPEEAPVGYSTTKSRRDSMSVRSHRNLETPGPETVLQASTIQEVPHQTSSQVSLRSIPNNLPNSALPNSAATSDISSSDPVNSETIDADDDSSDPIHPPVRTAAFQQVIPGETTLKMVEQLWGKPVKSTIINGQLAYLYSNEILNHIEVTFKDNLVKAIVVQLDEPFPEEQVREVLKTELLKSKPVLIPDEKGNIIGEVFPEKGVLFLFASEEDDGAHLVRQIGIEPVSSEPFVLRAEAIWHDQPSEAKRDLLDAVKINPEDSKAFGLLSQINLIEGLIDEAMFHCEKAIELDQRRPSHHLRLVQILIQMNRLDESRQYLEETIGICDKFPHEKARALSMLGDLYRTGRNSDCELSMECHSDAIRLAMTMTTHSNQTIRQSAKDVLFDAHLGAARDVAWGKWDNKSESINKWITRAKEIARDPEMLAAKRYSNEYPFKIATTALATQVGVLEQNELEPFIKNVVEAGESLIRSTTDAMLQRKYQWDISLSLYDAVQIYQLRRQYALALKYGEIAANYMEAGIETRKSDTDLYLLGRLYFRLGAIHAIGNKNHRAAIEWFDLAKPVFEKLLPKIDQEALGRIGETFVSMGVSYWMTEQREEAIRLTERGLKQIERGVQNGVLGESALNVPYTNLANMYQEMGEVEMATKYAHLAGL